MAAERLGEMTREDLKSLVQELVQETLQELLWSWEQELPDPDEGLELRPEIVALLLENQQNSEDTLLSLEDVKRELGIDE